MKMWELQTKKEEIIKNYDVEDVECKLVRLSINYKKGEPKKDFIIPMLHQ